MTAKERRAMRRLEIRVEELERQAVTLKELWADAHHDLYQARCALREVLGLMREGEERIMEVLARDKSGIVNP